MTDTTLRNTPVQARSRERLALLLSTADTLLATEGAEALTTTRIAADAGVALGSLYHFFEGKEGIVEALALRYWRSFEDRVTALADADAAEPVADPVAAVVTTLADALRSEPGFLALWYGGLRTVRVRDVTRPVRGGFARQIGRILAVHWPDADPALHARAAEMVVRTGDALLRDAFRLDPAGDADLLAETQVLLGAYLDARLGEAAR